MNFQNLLFDFHTHADYADGVSSATEMVESAIAKNLSVIGFTEHHPRHPDFRYRDDPSGEVRGLATWSDYIAEIDSLKKKYEGRIEILKGSEFDWLSLEHLDEWRKWRAETDWDYVIGSVHYIGHWGFDYLEDWDRRYEFPELKEKRGFSIMTRWSKFMRRITVRCEKWLRARVICLKLLDISI